MAVYLVLALLLQAALPAPQPDLQLVLHRVFDRANRDAQRQLEGGRWTKVRTDEDISDPKKTKTEHRERFHVWGSGNGMVQLKVWRDGRDVASEPQPLPLFIDKAFLDRFEYAFEDPAVVQCGTRECWRLAFTPKTDVTTKDGDLDQILLASSSGTLLVDTTDYGIVRADAHSLQPHKTFLFDVYWYSVSLTQVPVDGAMVTSTIEMSFAYARLFGGVKTKRRFYEYTEIALPPFVQERGSAR